MYSPLNISLRPGSRISFPLNRLVVDRESIALRFGRHNLLISVKVPAAVELEHAPAAPNSYCHDGTDLLFRQDNLVGVEQGKDKQVYFFRTNYISASALDAADNLDRIPLQPVETLDPLASIPDDHRAHYGLELFNTLKRTNGLSTRPLLSLMDCLQFTDFIRDRYRGDDYVTLYKRPAEVAREIMAQSGYVGKCTEAALGLHGLLLSGGILSRLVGAILYDFAGNRIGHHELVEVGIKSNKDISWWAVDPFNSFLPYPEVIDQFPDLLWGSLFHY